MQNKISALTLALLVTGPCFALELTPGENIVQQEAIQAVQIAENNAPRYRFITTSFGKIESKLEETNGKLELLVKEKVFDHGAVIAPFTAVAVPLFLALLPSKISGAFACAGVAGLSQVAILYRNNKGQTDSLFYKHAHDTIITLEKDAHGNWIVVNSVYDQEVNEDLAQAAAAIENDTFLNKELFAKLEKVFAAQQN